MNCARFESRLARYVESDLTLIEARRVEVHLAHCAECREEVHLLADVLPALGAARPLPSPWNGWKDLRRHMHELPPALPAPRPRPRASRRAGKLLLAAALALTASLVAAGLASAGARDDYPLAREISKRNDAIVEELGGAAIRPERE